MTAKRCDCIRTIAQKDERERGMPAGESHKMCCGLHVNIQIAAQLRCECVWVCGCSSLPCCGNCHSSSPHELCGISIGNSPAAYCLTIIL